MINKTDLNSRALAVMLGVTQDRIGMLPDWIERGVIGADLSLSTARHRFPAGSWRQPEMYALPDPWFTFEAHGETHSVPRPEAFRPLAAGDQVVVGLYLSGSEPCVLLRDVGTP